MKILRNKTYQRMVDTYNGLLKEKEQVERDYTISCEEYNKLLDEAESEQRELMQEIFILKEEKKKILGAKGGYVKEINKLKKQVEELEFKLKESMTDKYLVKKIKPGRTPKGPQMKLKDCSRVSNISRKVFGN